MHGYVCPLAGRCLKILTKARGEVALPRYQRGLTVRRPVVTRKDGGSNPPAGAAVPLRRIPCSSSSPSSRFVNGRFRQVRRGIHHAAVVKQNASCQVRDPGSIPGSRTAPAKGRATEKLKDGTVRNGAMRRAGSLFRPASLREYRLSPDCVQFESESRLGRRGVIVSLRNRCVPWRRRVS